MRSFWCLSITYLAGCETSRESGDLAQTCIVVTDKPTAEGQWQRGQQSKPTSQQQWAFQMALRCSL